MVIYIHTHTHIQRNITHPKKKNKIISSAAKRMDLEIVTMSEVRQKKINII